MQIIIRENCAGVDWSRIEAIYRGVKWGDRGGRDAISESFANTRYVAIAYDGDTIVGFGRMISDGIMYGAIYDVIVDAPLQNRGIGREIIGNLLMQGKHLLWITLFATPGKQGFYIKNGFKFLTTAMIYPKTDGILKNYCADMIHAQPSVAPDARAAGDR